MPKVSDAPEGGLLRELEAGLKIDKNDLDEAWIKHPDLTYKVGEQFALAISNRDALKLTIGEETAALDQQFRRQAAEAGEKVTETAIAKQIEGSQRMITLKQQYGQACYKADQWLALKEAFTQRSYALKYLVELYVAGYFASSSGGAHRRDATDRRAADARSQQGEARSARYRAGKDE